MLMQISSQSIKSIHPETPLILAMYRKNDLKLGPNKMYEKLYALPDWAFSLVNNMLKVYRCLIAKKCIEY